MQVPAPINTDFAQGSFESAGAQWRLVTDQLRGKFPKLADLMDGAEADVLAFMTFPKTPRTQIHRTNPLERLNAEIKRRTDVVGIFPNEASITRLSACCCSSRIASGNCCGAICRLRRCGPCATINPLGGPPWSAEYESSPARTHDSYTTPWDAIRPH